MNDLKDLVMKNRVIAGLLILIISAALYYCFMHFHGRISRNTINIPGTIRMAELRVRTKVSGTIKELNVKEGGKVNAGDVIARIDASEIESSLKSALAAERTAMSKSEKAAREFGRIYGLYEKDMVSKKQYDIAKVFADSSYNVYLKAKAAVESLNVQINNAVIKAPVGGTVLAKDVKQGDQISAGSVIVSIGDISKLEMKAYVKGEEYRDIRPGDKACISVAPYPGKRFYGFVRRISPAKGENAENILEIDISLPDTGIQLRPGMSANAEIKTK